MRFRITGVIYHVKEKDLIIKNTGIAPSEKSVPDDPLGQICISVNGVLTDGLSNFYSTFKKYTGCTPSDYRSMYRK